MKKLGVLVFALAASAFPADPTYADLLKAFQYRNLGPWRTGAWVSSLAVPETPAKAHRYTMFAGARTGGLWRTTNNGTTWEAVTDSVGIASVGAVAVAPSDANVVWVGTGDNSLTRSAYWGDGVYKSTDGGATWTNMGLRDTQHIARIVIHPTNPEIVWVAALGHLGTPNQERGVFRTIDGGRTWQKELFVNETSGAVDLVVDHRNPDVLYAAMYDAIRLPWKIMEARPGGGIFKTTDGGAKMGESGQRPAARQYRPHRSRHLPHRDSTSRQPATQRGDGGDERTATGADRAADRKRAAGTGADGGTNRKGAEEKHAEPGATNRDSGTEHKGVSRREIARVLQGIALDGTQSGARELHQRAGNPARGEGGTVPPTDPGSVGLPARGIWCESMRSCRRAARCCRTRH
jgi:hypothetical protein